MKRKALIAIVSAAAVIAGLASYGGYKAKAEGDAIAKLKSVVGTENGEIVSNGIKNLGDNKKYIEVHDNKYTYRLDPGTGDLKTFKVSSDKYDELCNVKGNLTQDEAIARAEDYLEKYAPGISSLKLQSISKKEDSVENFYMLDYDQLAGNGVKTGESITLWLNQSGDLILYIRVKGNPDIAMQKAKISGADAEKIAFEKVNSYSEASKTLPMEKSSELMVFQNRLVYEVKIAPVNKKTFMSTFYVKVDAQTGKVLDFSYTE